MIYDYECSDCGEEYEMEQKVSDKPRKKCPACLTFSLHRVILSAPMFFVKNDATTVGQVMDRNEQAMGTYELQEKRHDREEDHKNHKILAREQLAQRLPKGMKLKQATKDKSFGDLPSKIKQKADSGDTNAVEKFIMTGK